MISGIWQKVRRQGHSPGLSVGLGIINGDLNVQVTENPFSDCVRLCARFRGGTARLTANVNVCPRSDAQYALGEDIAAYQHALDHGIKPPRTYGTKLRTIPML